FCAKDSEEDEKIDQKILPIIKVITVYFYSNSFQYEYLYKCIRNDGNGTGPQVRQGPRGQ
ncbi:MAG: hypothetical protein ACXW2E_13050, partial [Nitrososphaeraceae archaeon]